MKFIVSNSKLSRNGSRIFNDGSVEKGSNEQKSSYGSHSVFKSNLKRKKITSNMLKSKKSEREETLKRKESSGIIL